MTAGFDYNQWAAMNLGKGSDQGDAATPESVFESGAENLAKAVGKTLGFNPTGAGGKTGYVGETNVGSSLGLNALSLFSSLESRGWLLSGILKYFTRDLPKGLTDDIQGSGGGGGGDAFASGGGGDFGGAPAGFGSGGGDSFSMGDMGGGFAQASFDSMPDAVSYGGKLMSAGVSDMVSMSFSQLGELPPPTMPAGMRSEGAGVAV